MKKLVCKLCICVMTVMVLTACGRAASSSEETLAAETLKSTGIEKNVSAQELVMEGADKTAASLPDSVSDSYYEGQSAPAFEYFKKSRIQKFLAMWVKEETGTIDKPQWNFDTFAKIHVLDHDFSVSRPEEELYYCTFSDGADRYGYIIVKYDEKGPSIGNWSLNETTPYIYDLKTYGKEIAASLAKTDIDLSTAKASRVYLFDREKNRADQVVRFTDGKGDNYICYFGESSFEAEKW